MPKTVEASFSVPYHIHKDLTLHSYHTSIAVSSSILRDMKTYREKRSFRYAFYVLNFENNTNWQMIVISVRVAAFVLLEHNSFSCFLVLLGQHLKVMNFFLPHLVSKIWHRKKRRFLCVFWISCVHRTASAKLLFADCHHVCFGIALRRQRKVHILQNNALRAGTYPLTGFFLEILDFGCCSEEGYFISVPQDKLCDL